MKARTILPFLGILAIPSPTRAQQEIGPVEAGPPTAPVTPATYVSDDRRDPFLPLTGTYSSEADGAPRLEQLELTGIFMGAPGNSLVVLEDHARRGYFMRAGETMGNARLLEILADAAVFEIDAYGILRRDTLRLLPDRRAVAAPPPSSEPASADSTASRDAELWVPARPQAEEGA